MPLFDALVSSFAFKAIRQLQENHSGSLIGALDAALLNPRLRQYAAWIVGVLEEDGMLVRGDAGWTLADQQEMPAAEDIWLTLMGDYPACLPDLVLAGRVGCHLAGLLDGSVDPDEFFQFPGQQ